MISNLDDNDIATYSSVDTGGNNRRSFFGWLNKQIIILGLVIILERCAFYVVVFNLPFSLFRYYVTKVSTGTNLVQCNVTGTPYDPGPEKPLKTYLSSLSMSMIVIGLYALQALTSALGGWLGDGRWGKFTTILTSIVLYIVASICFLVLLFIGNCIVPTLKLYPLYPNDTLASSNSNLEQDKPTSICFVSYNPDTVDSVQPILLTLFYVSFSLGYGLFKPNIAPFFSDQLHSNDRESIKHYLHIFYILINSGSLAAFGITFLQVERDADLYLMSFLTLLPIYFLCFVLLLLGSSHFVKVEPFRDEIKVAVKITKTLIKSVRMDKAVLERFNGSRLESFKIINGGDFTHDDIEAYKDITKMFPGLLLMLGFFVPYSNLNALFYTQGLYLQRPKHIPLSTINAVDPTVVIFLIPLMDLCVYPFLKRRFIKITYLDKLMVGLCLTGLSMIFASWVATFTQNGTLPENNPEHYNYIYNGTVKDDKITYRAHISIGFLFPQIALLAISEVFAIVGGMEYAYIEAPRAMKSVGMALFHTVNAIGDVLSILLMFVVAQLTNIHGHGWICDVLPWGHLDYFLMLNAVWALLFMGLALIWSGMLKRDEDNYYQYYLRNCFQ